MLTSHGYPQQIRAPTLRSPRGCLTQQSPGSAGWPQTGGHWRKFGARLFVVPAFEDFDRYIAEHGIPREHYPAAFALWIAEVTGGPVPRFEKVERVEPAGGVVIEGDATSRRAPESASSATLL